jgi:hypothetical protein
MDLHLVVAAGTDVPLERARRVQSTAVDRRAGTTGPPILSLAQPQNAIPDAYSRTLGLT